MKSPQWYPSSVREALEPEDTALIFWDLQYGLAGHACNLEPLKESWRRLRAAAEQAGIMVLLSRHVAPKPDMMDGADLWRISRRVRGANKPEDYMQEGSRDVEFLEGFEARENDLVIQKRTASLFIGTEAEARLHARGIRNIVMSGVATNIGIDLTARHALCLGFFPVIVEDAVGAFTPEGHDNAMVLMSNWSLVTDTDSVVTEWTK